MNRYRPQSRLARRARLLLVALIPCALLLASLSATHSQNGATLRGESRRVIAAPDTVVDAGAVTLKSDSDHDGMPDDDEASNGTDPNDPADADGDRDSDGLTNGDEVAGGSGVNNPDSDGDGVSDGDEARLGYNPTDANNTPPPNASVVSIKVAPDLLDLTLNSLLGSQPGQVTVTGTLSTGATVDLTRAPGTAYLSQNESIALVDDFGTAAGLTAGSTSITVTNGAHTASVPVLVSNFSPLGLSHTSIPGYPNNVVVQGSYAYIASGGAGLLVIDLTNNRAPRVVGVYDTPGNADDVKVAGDLAYVADGPAGLLVISVADKTHPRLLGSADTNGEAQDLALSGTHAYVADGEAGLKVIDVGDPAHPAVVGSLDTQGTARGVDVSGNVVVVADDQPSNALRVVNVENPQSPALLGEVAIPGEAKDVVIHEAHAYVCADSGGVQVVSLADTSAPRVVGTMTSFTARNISTLGRYGLFPYAQLFPAAGVPVVAISDPTAPNPRGQIDFTRLGVSTATGVGVTVDDKNVYTTAIVGSNAALLDNGTAALSMFFVGRHQPRYDRAGVEPTVTVETPAAGAQVMEGTDLFMSAAASDDVEVESVEFYVNGSFVSVDYDFPYEARYRVPTGGGGPVLDMPTASAAPGAAASAVGENVGAKTAASSVASSAEERQLTVTAVVTDLGGNNKTSAPVGVTVISQPPPAVVIVSPAEGATLIEGQTVNLLAQMTDASNVTEVVFTVNGVALPRDTEAPYQLSYTVPSGINSLNVTATAVYFGGETASATRTVAVTPPDPTTVAGRVLNFAGLPVEGASVSVFGQFTSLSAADGTFSVTGVPTTLGPVSATATATVDGKQLTGVSGAAPPAPGGTTNVGNILLQDVHYETEFGTLVNFNTTRADDAFAAVQLPFAFNYYGNNYTQVFVGTNGYLTFGSGDRAYEETPENFASGRPRIAPLFDDWYADQQPNRGVYVNAQLPGRVVFTWRGVEHAVNHGEPDISEKGNFQAILFEDGRIQFGYDDVRTLGGGVGITPGGTPNRVAYNFTSTPVWDGPGSDFFDENTAAYEQFVGIGTSPFDLRHAFITYAPRDSGGYDMSFYHAPQTTATGTLTNASGGAVAGATVSVLGRTGVSAADGKFSVERVPAAEGALSLKAVWVAPDGRLMQARTAPTLPVATGETDFGAVHMAEVGRAFETEMGDPVQHAPGSFPKVSFQLPFQFSFYGQSFYGQTFDRVYVNPAGHLTLTGDCVKGGCNDRFGLSRDAINDLIFAFSNTPIISPLLSDLDPGNTGQVYVKSSPDEWVMTFYNVRRPGLPGTNTFQVALRPDGTIRFAYNGVSNNYGHVGLSPGVWWGSGDDFYNSALDAAPASRVSNPVPFFQTFAGELDTTAARRDFDLDHQVLVFFPADDGSYEVVKQNLAPAPRSTILFESHLEGDWDIFSIDPDGRDLVNLTNHRADDYDGDFSPDGTKIAFDSYRVDPALSNEDVFVMNPDGTGLVNLTNYAGADDYFPHWSPDGSKILFYSNRNGGYEIFVMNADGSDQHSLTGHAGDHHPLWSPDGSKILVETDREGPQRLYLLDADGSNPRPLEGAGNFGGNADGFADWSPDGSRVAFHSYRNGEGHVFVVNVDGTGLTDLGEGQIPKWSPDGSKILFDHGDLFVMNADGSNVTQVSSGEAFIGQWSPDGSRIMYLNNNASVLSVVNADGTNPRVIFDKRARGYIDDWAVVP